MPTTTTYGKRSVKRKNTLDSRSGAALSAPRAEVEERIDPDDDDELLLQPQRATIRKKRRLESAIPVGEYFKEKKPSPLHESTEEKDTPEPLTSKARVTKTYGTPKKPIPSATATVIQESPSKPAQGSFLFPTLVSSSKTTLPTTPSRAHSPTKLAKRMLARSKTETSVESQSVIPLSFGETRSPSLPILPSSQNSLLQSHAPSLSPSRTNTLLNISSNTTVAGVSSSLLPLPTITSTATVSRTYAGKSRSYLLPSVSSSGMNPNGTIEDFDDEFSRESYTSLRQRWGVDQSEDDPYYDVDTSPFKADSSQSPSPSKVRTYAGNGNRSASSTPHPSPSKESKGKRKTGTSQHLRAPPLPPGMMNPLKSITELRNKGESRRFLDEVAYLLDGMSKTQGAGLIKASALEITTKLCDTEFFRKAKAADVFSKVYDLFVEAGVGRDDKVLDTLFLVYVVMISKDSPSLTELASHVPECKSPAVSNSKGKGKVPLQTDTRSLVDIVFSILDTVCMQSSDPLVLVASSHDKVAAYSDAELRRAGVGKKDKSTMTAVLSTIKNKSGVFATSAKIRTPLLITHILQSIPPSLIPQHHLPSLLHSLQEGLLPLQEWSNPSSDTLNLEEDVDFENVFSHLRLLDLYLLGQWASEESLSQNGCDGQTEVTSANEEAMLNARKAWLVDGLVSLGIRTEVSLQRDSIGYEGAMKCLESVLRVLVSLTHGDEVWAASVVLENARTLRFLMRVVAKSGEEVDRRVDVGLERKEEEEDEEELGGEALSHREKKARALDRLCLSLALLTNLVQALGDVKDLIRETYLDPACSLSKSSCLDACSCSKRNSASGLEILVQLYSRLSRDRQEEGDVEEESLQLDADASFLRGHLAVLFGLFMQSNEANQSTILSLLPAPSGTQTAVEVKLNGLVDQARQFVAFFAVVVGHTSDEQEGRRVDEREKEVAQEIVQFLEGLGRSYHCNERDVI